ncbi:hypothetical protein [Paenibacillus xylanivorans]|uniref:hypothetical protein n=1 Tax=Paenibacillus xylanivorans TaxID=1705561 RepID=UPI000A58D89E|nr:hypothetical protein [Paenibacillus xylanivorans]
MREALAEVLSNPLYKQQAYLIGESLWQAGGYKRAVEMIMSHLASAQGNISNTKLNTK